MRHFIKLLWLLIRGIVFSDPKEADIRSKDFNPRKFIASIMLLLSIGLNCWQGWRHFDLGREYVTYREFIKTNDPALYEKSQDFRKKKAS